MNLIVWLFLHFFFLFIVFVSEMRFETSPANQVSFFQCGFLNVFLNIFAPLFLLPYTLGLHHTHLAKSPFSIFPFSAIVFGPPNQTLRWGGCFKSSLVLAFGTRCFFLVINEVGSWLKHCIFSTRLELFCIIFFWAQLFYGQRTRHQNLPQAQGSYGPSGRGGGRPRFPVLLDGGISLPHLPGLPRRAKGLPSRRRHFSLDGPGWVGGWF